MATIPSLEYDQGIVYGKTGIQPHYAYLKSGEELLPMADKLGPLFASAPVLAAALREICKVYDENYTGTLSAERCLIYIGAVARKAIEQLDHHNREAALAELRESVA